MQTEKENRSLTKISALYCILEDVEQSFCLLSEQLQFVSKPVTAIDKNDSDSSEAPKSNQSQLNENLDVLYTKISYLKSKIDFVKNNLDI